jgi:hypothetical protein
MASMAAGEKELSEAANSRCCYPTSPRHLLDISSTNIEPLGIGMFFEAQDFIEEHIEPSFNKVLLVFSGVLL